MSGVASGSGVGGAGLGVLAWVRGRWTGVSVAGVVLVGVLGWLAVGAFGADHRSGTQAFTGPVPLAVTSVTPTASAAPTPTPTAPPSPSASPSSTPSASVSPSASASATPSVPTGVAGNSPSASPSSTPIRSTEPSPTASPSPSPSPSVTLVAVPNLAGMSVAAADRLLRDDGFAAASAAYACTGPDEGVYAQKPAAGTRVPRTTAVSVQAMYPDCAQYPNVQGLYIADADDLLNLDGFTDLSYQPAACAPSEGAWQVSLQVPAGGGYLRTSTPVVLHCDATAITG